MKKTIRIDNLADMRNFAATMAASLKGTGTVLALEGDLGAGKTTFTQAFAAALGVRRPVTSPTFTLVGEYALPDDSRLVHMDLYRLKAASDLDAIGFDEYLLSGDLVCIEWPDRAKGSLPENTLYMHIEIPPNEPDARLITLSQIDS